MSESQQSSSTPVDPLLQIPTRATLTNDLEKLAGRGNSLALVGAGVSIWAGYGSWAQVIQHLAAAVHAVRPELDTQQIIDNNPNPLHCAKHLGAYLGPRFAEFIRAEFGPNGKKPDPLLFQLCSLPFKHFLTLDFDYSLEQIHGALNRAYHTVSVAASSRSRPHCLGVDRAMMFSCPRDFTDY